MAVTDKDGDTGGGNLVINIVDDAPVARADADAIATGQTTAETGNVLTGEGTAGGLNGSGADVLGADGAPLTGAVVGITSNNNGTTGTVGVAIAGAFGTLTLNADGSYSYTCRILVEVRMSSPTRSGTSTAHSAATLTINGRH